MTDAKNAIANFNRIIDAVEDRCLAADGPVTPTLQEMREDELRVLWLSVQAIRASVIRAETRAAETKQALALAVEIARLKEDMAQEEKVLGYWVGEAMVQRKRADAAEAVLSALRLGASG